jgi:hypothetical protein
MFVLQSVSRSGEDCLLILSENRISMMLKRSDGSVRDFSWLGYTMVADLSPDGRSVLFFDGGATEKTAGAWIRPLEGGDAVPLGAGEPWHFSPDGHWFVSSTRARAGPPQIDLVPVGAGSRRSLTAPPADFSEPSFAGSDAILCVRSYAGKQEIWRLETSGGKGRSLGVEGCGQPMASPSLREFLCLGGKERDALLVYPISGGTGRRLYDLSGRTQLRSARWDETGDRIFAVTAERRLLTLDVRSGALLHEETLALPDVGVYGVFYRAALSADGRTQAYSVARSSSGLYLCGGIR